MADADQFQPGITTYDQAVAKLGPPAHTAAMPGGQKAAGWTYIQSSASLVGAKSTSQRVMIMFGADGVMVGTVSRTLLSGS